MTQVQGGNSEVRSHPVLREASLNGETWAHVDQAAEWLFKDRFRSKPISCKKLIFNTFNGFKHISQRTCKHHWIACAPVPHLQAGSLFWRYKRPAQLARPEFSKQCSIDSEMDHLSLCRSLFAFLVYIRRRIRPIYSHWIGFL